MTHLFDQALVRPPGQSCVRGLRAVDRGAPDPKRLRQQHRTYSQALQDAGLAVHTLPPDEVHPDSVFVEDPALCIPECAILLRPGATSRAGEVAGLATPLQELYGTDVARVADGCIEGGDILILGREIVVGLSARTTRTGVEELRRFLPPHRPLRVVDTPSGVLHLKSECTTLGEGRVLATRRLARTGVFSEYDVIVVPEGEEPAANALRLNERVLVAEGYPATAELLDRLGYAVVVLDISEAEKLDAGLSCMSLRLPRSRAPLSPG